jgi:hypothetical protein
VTHTEFVLKSSVFLFAHFAGVKNRNIQTSIKVVD